MGAFQTISFSRSSDFIRENIVSGEFQIRKPPGFSFLNSFGNYPKQVQIGDVLFSSEFLNILSPVSGFASASEDKQDTIVVSMNGSFLPKENPSKETFSLKTLKEKILGHGNSSLDFSNKTLIHCLNEFSGKEDSLIVFSPFTKDNCIDFREKILSEYSEEFELIKKNFSEIFPKSKVIDFVTGKKRKFHYPAGTPLYFLYKFAGIQKTANFPHENVLFFGSETLYYLLRSLYFGIPFYERMISVNLLGKNGKLKMLKKPVLLRNGQNTGFITKDFEKKFASFSLNSHFDLPEYFQSSEDYYLNIYTDYSMTLIAKEPVNKKEFPCIECNDCSLFCPLNLEPRTILDDGNKDFQSRFCIECGICTVFCPSGINFRKKITDLKRADYAIA